MTATQLNPQGSSMFRAWSIVLTSALFFFYIFIQMNLFNAINSEFVKELHFTASQVSQLFASYSYGNVIFLFPAGMLLDRFSVRNLLTMAFVVTIVAAYAFSVSSTFWIMNTARLVIGLAGAFAFLSAVKLVSRWFEPRHMALAIGVVVTMAMFGGVIAQTPLALLTQQFGWRYAVQFVSIMGAVLMLLQIIIVRDQPEQLDITNEQQPVITTENFGFWQSLYVAISNKQNWLGGIYISLVNLPLFIFGGIWGVPYLTNVHHFTEVEASGITSMIFIGMIVGSPLAGLISDRMGLRKLPMIIGSILCILVILGVIFAPTLPLYGEICLYFALGVVASAQVIGYPLITESNPSAITATANSLSSTLIMSGGMLVPFFGWLLERSGEAQVVNGGTIYTQADFMCANHLMLVGLVIALLASLFIKETYCKQLQCKGNSIT